MLYGHHHLSIFQVVEFFISDKLKSVLVLVLYLQPLYDLVVIEFVAETHVW
jgi:hypothetical protein